MMVFLHVGFETSSLAFHGYFPNQAGRRHGVQALVHGSERSPRIRAIYGFVDLLRRGMPRAAIQVIENRIPLRCAADFSFVEGGEDLRP